MLEKNRVYNGDCMHYLKLVDDCSVDLHYTDTPYNMGSKYIIDKEGHYVFSRKGSDFMNKWEAMDGRWWDKYFAEINRTLKIGGFYITHNIDRQSDMWTYYARKNGLMPMQKLYWLFISNFPKASDAKQMIDKKLGDNEISDKYNGYKYGQACLKQILEEILVFYKEPNESVVDVIIKHESDVKKGLPSIYHPPVLNIGKTLVLPSKKANVPQQERYTPQMAVATSAAPYIKSGNSLLDFAGISDTLAKIEYGNSDLIPYMYEPKISKSEKEDGLEGHAIVERKTGNKGLYNENGKDKWASKSRNTHPTPKPINLCKWILTLFKTPGSMVAMDTFAGQGSIIKACIEMGVDFIGTEINEEYYKLCLSKINNVQDSLF